MFKKKIIWMAVFLVLALLTIWTVCTMSSSFSPEMLRESLNNSRPIWTFAAGLCVFGNIFSEGRAIDILITGLLEKRRRRGMLYASADIYFSAITPSSTGGQPASAYFMIRDGISAAETTVILVVNLIMYSAALIVSGIVALIICPEIIDDFSFISRVLIVIGYIFLGMLSAGFILMLVKQDWIRALARLYAMVGSKLHIVRDKEKVYIRTENLIDQYRNCVSRVKGKTSMLIRALMYNLLQRFCMIGTTLCLFIAMYGGKEVLGTVFGVQTYAYIGSFGMPIPGAVGAADYLMIDGFKHIPEILSPANFELLSRGISFYCCIVLSLVITMAGYYMTKKDRGEL